MHRNPYEILQVSPNAEQEVIEAAYRRLARKYHPDMSSDRGATIRMQEINWAYGILRDTAKRAEHDLRMRAWRMGQRPDPRPQPQPEPAARETASRPASEPRPRKAASPPKATSREPTYLSSVLIGLLLLGGYYLLSFLVQFAAAMDSTSLALIFTIISIFGSGLLAIAAAAGWHPKRIHVGRVLLMWALTAFPISSWIPCYLAGKAIARRTVARKVVNRSQSMPSGTASRWPVVVFGLFGIALNVLVFGDLLDQDEPAATILEFDRYRNSEIGVAFEHPTFLLPEATTNKQRTDVGTVFSVSTISAESSNPALALGLRIIEDPLRNEMFPELYPPSDDALRILLIGDIVDFQFSEDEVSQEQRLTASQESRILQVSGYPAAEYSLSARDTVIGDALLRGALIVTDRRDVSIFLVGSVESGVDGSFTSTQIETIWEQLLGTLELDY